jgi:hypothetical protein
MSDATPSPDPRPEPEPARDFAAWNAPLFATEPAPVPQDSTPKKQRPAWQKITVGVAALGLAFTAGFATSAGTSGSSGDGQQGPGGQPPGISQNGYGFGGQDGFPGGQGGQPPGMGQDGSGQNGAQGGTTQDQSTTGQGT